MSRDPRTAFDWLRWDFTAVHRKAKRSPGRPLQPLALFFLGPSLFTTCAHGCERCRVCEAPITANKGEKHGAGLRSPQEHRRRHRRLAVPRVRSGVGGKPKPPAQRERVRPLSIFLVCSPEKVAASASIIPSSGLAGERASAAHQRVSFAEDRLSIVGQGGFDRKT